MTETNTYSPDQRDSMKQRAIHDAELLQGGADYSEHGVLTPTAHQKESMAQVFTGERKERFYEETLEGQQIEAHKGMLREIGNILGSEMGYVAEHKVGQLPSLAEYAPWLKDNNIDIDVDALSVLDPKNSVEASEHYAEAISKIQDSNYELQILADKLIQYPQFGIGHEVTVMRNGKDGAPNYLQSGWKVEKVLGNARLKVAGTIDGEPWSKSVLIDQLRTWSQPRSK